MAEVIVHAFGWRNTEIQHKFGTPVLVKLNVQQFQSIAIPSEKSACLMTVRIVLVNLALVLLEATRKNERNKPLLNCISQFLGLGLHTWVVFTSQCGTTAKPLRIQGSLPSLFQTGKSKNK